MPFGGELLHGAFEARDRLGHRHERLAARGVAMAAALEIAARRKRLTSTSPLERNDTRMKSWCSTNMADIFIFLMVSG